MALPPRHVYSAIVKNAGKAVIKVTATFTFHDGSTETEEITIPTGESATFNAKTAEEGSMTTISHITTITATNGDKSNTITHPFNVHSPTHGYHFTIGDDLVIDH